MKDPEAQKRGRQNKSRGKALERRVRDLLIRLAGGNEAERIMDQGRRYPDLHAELACPLCNDFTDPMHEHGDLLPFVIEVKSRQHGTPAYLLEAWDQVTRADLTKRIPFVTLTFVDEGRRSFWLVTRLEEGS